jgi:hypothetical protein
MGHGRIMALSARPRAMAQWRAQRSSSDGNHIARDLTVYEAVKAPAAQTSK